MESCDSLVKELEKKLNIEFNNIDIFKTALTHSSYANGKKGVKYNERLEFLGDSVLQLCMTEYLFHSYKNKSEGELTKIRALIVCEASLFEIAQKLSIGKYISMSKGEELTGGRERTSILADSVEAILAAIYLDQGFSAAKQFILKNFMDTIEKAVSNNIVIDFKTRLQEKLQKSGVNKIEYEIYKQDGPPHRRQFYCKVLIGSKDMGKGIGYSKKEAEQFAAKEALSNLEAKYE